MATSQPKSGPTAGAGEEASPGRPSVTVLSLSSLHGRCALDLTGSSSAPEAL